MSGVFVWTRRENDVVLTRGRLKQSEVLFMRLWNNESHVELRYKSKFSRTKLFLLWGECSVLNFYTLPKTLAKLGKVCGLSGKWCFHMGLCCNCVGAYG